MIEPDEKWERSLRHLDVEDLTLLATALEEKCGNFKPGVGFNWQDERAEELWFVICMVLEVDGNRPVWQQTHVFPVGDQRWWALAGVEG